MTEEKGSIAERSKDEGIACPRRKLFSSLFKPFKRSADSINLANGISQKDSLSKHNLLTRRRFLEVAVVGGAALLAPGQLEKTMMEILFQFFSNSHDGEKAIKLIADKLGNEKINPNYRPINTIIEEGIVAFENQTGKKAKFQRSSDYKDFSSYQEIIAKVKQSMGLLPENPEDLMMKFVDLLPQSDREVFQKSHDRQLSFDDCFPQEGGVGSRLAEKYLIDMTTMDADSQRRQYELKKQEAQKYILETKGFIEGEVAKNKGKPVSASRLFSFFLDKNEGDINRSLIDTYAFLKFASRNNFATGSYSAFRQDPDWMVKNILDEYGLKSYDEEAKKQTIVNLVGKPYHSWNLVAMLGRFPVGLIHMGGVARQLIAFGDQGIDKLQSDLVTLSELQATETLLLNYRTEIRL